MKRTPILIYTFLHQYFVFLQLAHYNQSPFNNLMVLKIQILVEEHALQSFKFFFVLVPYKNIFLSLGRDLIFQVLPTLLPGNTQYSPCVCSNVRSLERAHENMQYTQKMLLH